MDKIKQKAVEVAAGLDIYIEEELWDTIEVDGVMYDINAYSNAVFSEAVGVGVAVYPVVDDPNYPGCVKTDTDNCVLQFNIG